MSIWKIGNIDAVAGNLSGLRITFNSRRADEVTFTDSGAAYDGPQQFAYGQVYDITKDGRRVFSGRCITIPRQGSGREESIEYKLVGGWWWLENIMYTQTWPAGEENLPVVKTRVILGYDDAGNEINCNDQIRDILTHAISKEAPFVIGLVNVSTKILPHDEQVDLTCAEAIERCLAWFPDTAVWIDYTTAVPTINLSRRASLSAAVVGTADVAESVQITPRYDARVPGVRLIYEITSATGEGRVRDIKVDEAGDPDAFGAMTHTIQLNGGSVNYLWQHIKSDGTMPSNLTNYVPGQGSPRISAKAWWAKKLPHLAKWEDVTLHDPEPLQWPPMEGVRTLDNELLDGEIQDWMFTWFAKNVTAKVRADYTLNGQTVKDELLSYNLTVTNAPTGLYNALSSFEASEQVPAGLAAEIYAAVGTLHYEGSVVVVDQEPPDLAGVKNVLNLSGGASEWTRMRACIQSVQWEVDNGTTTISFGPPEFLGVADLVQMSLANTRRGTVNSLARRQSSAVEDDGTTIGGPGSKGNSTAGGKRVTRQEYGEEGEPLKVIIDGESGKVTATNGPTTLELDPEAQPEVIKCLQSLKSVAREGDNLRLTFMTMEITKVSNAILSAKAGEDQVFDMPLMRAAVLTNIAADGTTIVGSLLEAWLIDSQDLDVVDLIEGEECP